MQAADNGTVSQHLVHRARRGDLIHLGPAAGEALDAPVAPATAPGSEGWLFVTAGSGLTVALEKDSRVAVKPPKASVVFKGVVDGNA